MRIDTRAHALSMYGQEKMRLSILDASLLSMKNSANIDCCLFES